MTSKMVSFKHKGVLKVFNIKCDFYSTKLVLRSCFKSDLSRNWCARANSE